MHDPKFEKEVQQRMAKLEFSPSESIWANIEKEVNQPRDRRRFPFFWRLALPGLVILTAGTYYFFRSKPAALSPAYPVAVMAAPNALSASPSSSKTANRDPAMEARRPTGAAASTKASPFPSISMTPAQASMTPASASSTPAPTAVTSAATAATPAARPTISSKAAARGSATPRTRTRIALPGNRPERHPADQSVSEALSDDLIVEAWGKRNSAPGKTGAAKQPTEQPTEQLTEQLTEQPTEQLTKRPILFNTGLANLSSAAAPIRAGKPETKNTFDIKKLQSPRRVWEGAFAGGIGVSSLHQAQIGNVALSNATTSSSSLNSIANYVTYSAARPSKQYVSSVKPGISFWAGVVAKKPLSDKWSLSLGLNFYYYSTRVRLGEEVDSYTASTATLLASSAVAPVQSYPYYNAGNDQTYTNHYYYLELPVAAEWKINRSHLLPLFWDGGFSVYYLMGSSAVYYSTKSGVYFKDKGVANHAQVNISTALMVGLPVRGLRVQLGPQVQYGLTPLLNTKLSGSEHIFYGGLRLVIYPGKK